MVVNGFPIRNASVMITVEGQGQVTYYDTSLWSGSLPAAPKEIISEAEVKRILERRLIHSLTYIKPGLIEEPFLAYSIGEIHGATLWIDAITGDVTGWEGNSLVISLLKTYVGPLIAEGKIKMTIPEKPKSKFQ